jgi:hypothetical protein
MQKQSKLNLIIMFVISILLLSTSVVFAVFSFTIDENRPYSSGTELFTLNSSSLYYDSFSVTNSTFTSVVNKTNSANDTNSYDVLVYSSTNNITLNSNASSKVITLDDGSYVNIFTNHSYVSNENLIFSNVGTTAKVVVLTYSDKNYYISNFFELQCINNDKYYNYDNKITYTDKLSFYENTKYVYFVNNVVVNKDLVINYPCIFNLLYSTITLQSNLTIKHNGYGYYEIETIQGKIDNTNYILTISSPNALYRLNNTVLGESVLYDTTANHYVKNSDNIDFTDSANSSYLDALILDAKDFAFATVENYVVSDIVLPTTYQNYNITYSYSVQKSSDSDPETLNSFGNVKRSAQNYTNTLNVTLTFNGNTYTSSKEVIVVGTSDSSLIFGLSKKIDKAILSTSIKDNNVNYLTKALYLNPIINDYLKCSNTTNIYTLTFANSSYLQFNYSNNVYKKVKLQYDSGTIKIALGDSDTYSELNSDLYLGQKYYILQNATQSLTIGTNSESTILSINLLNSFASSSQDKKYEFLSQRYFFDAYFSKSTDTSSILWVDNGSLTFGNNNILCDEFSDMTSVSYNIYKISTTTLSSLDDTTLTLESFLQDSTLYTNVNSYFNIVNGLITPNTNTELKLEDNENLIIVVDFNYLVDSTETHYYAYKNVVISSNGIGGNQYTEFINGNTYGSYFNGLVDGKLIDSVIDSTAHKFSTDNSSVGLTMEITNTQDVSSFCTIDNRGRMSQIGITVANIPNKNTIIHLLVTFYVLDTSPLQIISTQNYSFVIPGIYHLGSDFVSSYIYNRIISAVDESNNTLYDSYDGYLLVDGASNSVDSFDCSLSTLTGATSDTVIDLTGINYLTNTKGFKFDNCKITSLLPFTKFTTDALQTLSLSNCSISDTILSTGYLYSLYNLETLNLSSNSITTIGDSNNNCYLYRTITSLDISSQNVEYSNIDNINLLPYLKVLNISNNKIAKFYPLTKLDYLTSVYLYNNVDNRIISGTSTYSELINDGKTYYGTDGEINKSILIHLSNSGVAVYNSIVDNTPMDIKNSITTNQKVLAALLNSIMYFSKQTNTINLPNTVYEYDFNNSGTTNGTAHTLTVNYILTTSSVLSTGFTHTNDTLDITSISSGSGEQSLCVIYSTTINGETMYSEQVVDLTK